MAKQTLTRMEIEPAENGGHTVTHHYKSSPSMVRGHMESHYVEPEKHIFSESEGHKAIAHIAEHAGIKLDEVREPAEEKEE